jgi:hypothetical protein
MHGVQVFLPRRNDRGKAIPERELLQLAADLSNRFGGLPACARAAATGLWKTRRHGQLVRSRISTSRQQEIVRPLDAWRKLSSGNSTTPTMTKPLVLSARSASRNSTGRVRRAAPLAVIAVALAACNAMPPIHGAPEQAPLVAQRDARIGVFYAGPARAAEYADVRVRIRIGAASVSRLDQAFAALFRSTTRVPDWPPWRSTRPALDAIMEVDSVTMSVAWRDEVQNPPAAGIVSEFLGAPVRVRVRYHACLFRPDRQLISCWEAISLGDRQVSDFGSYAKSVAALADQAMTGATAQLMLSIESDAAVRTWLQTIDTRAP